MASQSLYRKWRSQTFGELVGQEPVIRTLKNALSNGNLAHAYLFTGPRGTGKTSTARLLAKTINCLHPQNGEPCNTCDQCREITTGNSFNVMEIDAASNRGIDSIRELREKVMVPPSTGKYKVYILDEAHMLTVEAFNALLKTLEEPPPHAIFVLATTEVHKMLPTVLSRCQRFDFKRITTRQIVEHLNYIAEEEQVTLEQGAAELIARTAAGGMRDALSLLDQAIAYSGDTIPLSKVQAMLGVADPRAIQKLVTSVAQLDSAAGLHLVHELSEAGADLRQINGQVAEYWRAMMLAKAGADIATILDSTEDEVREITEAAGLFDLMELTECARVFAQNDLVQKSQGTPQLGLELALLTCIELHRRAQSADFAYLRTTTPAQPSSESPQPVHQSTRPHINAPEPAPPASRKSMPPSIESGVLQHEAPGQAAEEVPEETIRNITTFKRRDDLPSTPHEQASQPPVPEAEIPGADAIAEDTQSSSDLPALTMHDLKNKWEYVRRRIRTKRDGSKVAAFLNGYTIIGVEGSAELPIVVIKANASFHYASLQNKKEYQEIIEWGLKIELGQECRIRLLPPHADVQALHIPSSPQPSSGAPKQTPDSSLDATAQPQAQHDKLATQSVDDISSSASVEVIAPPGKSFSSPLARSNVVRENTTKTVAHTQEDSGTTRLELTKKKATSDPVVQKVVEMFKAEIKDINLK
jgi:DNA polymerase III subunit gamma/tau